MARKNDGNYGSEQDDLQDGMSRGLDELTTAGAALEPVGNMGMDAIELEAFMNEPVGIYVHPTKEKGSLDVITPSVNGVNQPIVRGQRVSVKRKYVEALARCHSLRYEQQVQNPSQPENIQMVEMKVPDYPFDVTRDTPKGKAWLRAVYQSV